MMFSENPQLHQNTRRYCSHRPCHHDSAGVSISRVHVTRCAARTFKCQVSTLRFGELICTIWWERATLFCMCGQASGSKLGRSLLSQMSLWPSKNAFYPMNRFSVEYPFTTAAIRRESTCKPNFLLSADWDWNGFLQWGGGYISKPHGNILLSYK